MMHITETCRDSSQDTLPGRSDGGGSEELRLSEGPDGVCCDVAETPEGTRLFARVGGGIAAWNCAGHPAWVTQRMMSPTYHMLKSGARGERSSLNVDPWNFACF